jgi:non-specific serine/threonine protein kinase/serine/threonine-protein kinase
LSSHLHARIKEIFLAVCEREATERPDVLEEMCGADVELRREVESLLGFHEPPASTPERIASYRLLQKIGEGGMGEVYEATQLEPVRRRVALKVIKAGMDSKAIVARFESERQALALMDHPNIARIFDAGTTERGRPYFAMEYVAGEPITSYCDRMRLGMGERLELFVQVCDGVQHAHQKGVIHRDIKPSNVLVRILDARPVPTIIDFGIAKATQQRLTEQSVFTTMGMLIGTPEYMSPEQAEMTGLDVDTRTDVYSLGVMLYELLTGALPFDPGTLREGGFDEIRRRIREQEPSKPSTRVSTLGEVTGETANRRRTDPTGLRRQLRGDLDRITMKALEKDRTRRYASPSELAADIERHLRHEPVLASPPGTLYRGRKFVRRHRVGVAAGALVMAALLAGVAGTSVGFVRAKREAETARRVSGFLQRLFDDVNPGAARGSITTPAEILDRGAERIETELAGQPLVQADLMVTLGNAYRGLGLYERADPLFERSAAIHREHLGPGSLEYASSISFLGDLRAQTGRYAEARQQLEEALAIRRVSLRSDDPRLAWSLRSLGHVYWRTSELETARSVLQQALEIGESTRDRERLDVAMTLILLALVELDYREYDSARQRLERSLELGERVLGPDHILVADVLGVIGRTYHESGDLEAARPLFERAVAIVEGAGGPDHPRIAIPLQGLARVLSSTGDHDGARTRFHRALAIQESGLGPDHPDIAYTLRGIGTLNLRSGDLAGARGAYERAMAIAERAFGPEHLDVARAAYDLGYLEYRAGDHVESRRQHERALEIFGKIFGSGHRVLAASLYSLACLSALENDREKAFRLLRESFDHGFALPYFLRDPDFDTLRGDPEFEAIVREFKARLPEE